MTDWYASGLKMVRKDYFHDANDALITTLEASDIEEYKVMEKKEKISIGFAC